MSRTGSCSHRESSSHSNKNCPTQTFLACSPSKDQLWDSILSLLQSVVTHLIRRLCGRWRSDHMPPSRPCPQSGGGSGGLPDILEEDSPPTLEISHQPKPDSGWWRGSEEPPVSWLRAVCGEKPWQVSNSDRSVRQWRSGLSWIKSTDLDANTQTKKLFYLVFNQMLILFLVVLHQLTIKACVCVCVMNKANFLGFLNMDNKACIEPLHLVVLDYFSFRL